MPRTEGQLGAMIKLGGRVQPRHEADSQGPTLGRRCRHLIGCGIRTGEGLFRFSVEARGGLDDRALQVDAGAFGSGRSAAG